MALNELYDLQIEEISIVGGLGKAGPAVQDSKILVIKSEEGGNDMADSSTTTIRKGLPEGISPDEVFPEDSVAPSPASNEELTPDDLSDSGKEKVTKATFKHFLKKLAGIAAKEDDDSVVKETDIEKAKDFEQVSNERNLMEMMRNEFDTLMSALWNIMSDEDEEKPMDAAEKSIKQFNSSVLKKLKDIKSGNVSKEAMIEAEEHVNKAGAVFSKKNLEELRKAQEIITSLIKLVEGDNVSKESGGGQMAEELRKEIDDMEYVSKDGGQTFSKIEGHKEVGEEKGPSAEEEDEKEDKTEEVMKEREEFKNQIVKAVNEAVKGSIDEKLESKLEPIDKKIEEMEGKLEKFETAGENIKKDLDALMRISGVPKNGEQEAVSKEDKEDSFADVLL